MTARFDVAWVRSSTTGITLVDCRRLRTQRSSACVQDDVEYTIWPFVAEFCLPEGQGNTQAACFQHQRNQSTRAVHNRV